MNKSKQVALIVLDGWGYREDPKDNAIAASKKPFFDSLWRDYPHSLLKASGNAVGLPEGQMGNSEVGHTTIGAGKICDTELVRIGKSIESGEFDKNPAFTSLFEHVKKHDSVLHAQGLVSSGGVHSHQEHLYAFLRLAKKVGIKKVAIHVFTDGRDTAPQSGAGYLKDLEKVVAEVGNAFIASISGRFYAMDRDQNWDRLKKAEEAIFECKGNVCSIKPSAYLESLYKQNLKDELLEPIVCLDEKGQGCAISKNDGVLFFNFRADRARMLTEKILERQKADNLAVVTFCEYDPDYKCLVAFPPIKIETTLAAEISKAGLTQAHIAETEKFPHATYFLNGGREEPYKNEKHIMLPSRKDIKTHDQAPKMRAEGIADKAVEEIKAGDDFIFINFANPDMVGHTANVPAIVEAIEETDRQLKRVIEALTAAGGVAFITADHGNAEINVDQQTGIPHTSHTTNPVPAILTSHDYKLKDGGLADIAPTILQLLNLGAPKSMLGQSLIS
ncbi:MAG: 2,3-bisphosphoglycerate-independent phosphoglycerate mutase [Candidatus Paceibacterota bacterium]|jgi:2,3-bisphosphoglycerate-independent phosphoglycerate mutase